MQGNFGPRVRHFGLWWVLDGATNPELMEVVLVGNYDANIALNSQVSTLESYY
jgi:hypothetical protein